MSRHNVMYAHVHTVHTVMYAHVQTIRLTYGTFQNPSLVSTHPKGATSLNFTSIASSCQ